jgi:SAUR family protein
MAAATEKGARRKSLVSRTLDRCRSGLTSAGGKPPTAAGCFSVYVGPERERFVVRADRANHPLFRRLLDDAECEYGYAAQGPLTLPCAVDAFLDVLWHMDNDHYGGYRAVARTSPICGLQRGGSGDSKGRAAGHRVLSSAKSSPASFFFLHKAPSSSSSPPPPPDGKSR